MLGQGSWMHLNKPKVLILSGGQGKRYGSPKALAFYKGETFLDTILSKCLSLNLEVFVVLNSQLAEIIGEDSRFTTIMGDSTKDMYDSILKGIKEIKEFSQLIIWPVDHPFVTIDTLNELIKQSYDDKCIVPACSGKLGHPIILPYSAVGELSNCNNLRKIISILGRLIVEVDDEGILYNINKKEDLP